jgi:putative colanic acid biosynthesis acetyltransferase WcaF
VDFKKNQILDYAVTNALNGGASFILKNRLIRVIWNVVWLIAASWTPPFMHRWRRRLLIIFGAKMGLSSDVRGSARVWYPPFLELHEGALIAEHVSCYNQANIVLGKCALVSQGAHLCTGTHNIDDPNFQLVAKSISIGENAWIAAEAFVGPGVTIGDYAVLGARAVTFKDVGSAMVFIGNPAMCVRKRVINYAV